MYSGLGPFDCAVDCYGRGVTIEVDFKGCVVFHVRRGSLVGGRRADGTDLGDVLKREGLGSAENFTPSFLRHPLLSLTWGPFFFWDTLHFLTW